MALLGCNVVSTDQVEVLPLLMRNVERNTSRIMQTSPDAASFGSIEVAELDWGNPEHIRAVDPPFDYIIGSDVVYAEHLLEPLLRTIFTLSGPRTTILLGYEIRSTTVHEQMLAMWKSNFEVKTVPRTKMDSKYQHASIQLFIMGLKSRAGCAENPMQRNAESSHGCRSDEDGESCDAEEEHVECGYKSSGECRSDEDGESCDAEEEHVECGNKGVMDGDEVGMMKTRKLDDWEARRYGSIAAWLLRDVKIT